MKVTILSHNLSSNASMRAHRLAVAAAHFAEVTLIGPVERRGLWPALPQESWIKTVTEERFPRFTTSFLQLVRACEGDVLIAVKPHMASFGAALVAAECRQVPVILDLDDLDIALAPRSDWAEKPSMADLRRPASAVYLSLLTKATGAASAITVASIALRQRFGGTLVPHGSLTELFNPDAIDREKARRGFGFNGPTVLFPGTPRWYKGLKPLAKALTRVPGARLAVLCRPEDLATKDWDRFPMQRIPMISYAALPALLAAADVVAIPQLDTEPARYQMPMKAYDCMAMAKPIVASAISDLPETLADCARLVPPGDVEQLAEAIDKLLAHPEEARRLGEKARARCLQHYSMHRIAEKLCSVVSQLAPSEPAGFTFHVSAQIGSSPDAKQPKPVGQASSLTVEAASSRHAAPQQTQVSTIPVLDPFGVDRDPKMRFLAEALTPALAERRLAQCWAEINGAHQKLRLRAIKVARYKPARRCLIEYDVSFDGPRSPAGPLTLLGKANAREPDATTHDLLETLRNAGFGANATDGISVPEPLGIIPEFQMWLQMKMPGMPATELFSKPGGIELARRVAEAAHKLHQAGVATERRHTLTDELRILKENLALVGRSRPQWAARLQQLFAACEQLAASMPQSQPCGIHRDFYPAQVMVLTPSPPSPSPSDGEGAGGEAIRICLVDFDLYCLGDPALDIGNFIGHMSEQSLRQLGNPRALAGQERALEERFLQLSGESAPKAFGAIQCYTTLTLARHIYLSTQFPERQNFTEA